MAGEERVTKLKIDNVKKIYQTRKGEMTALNGVNLVKKMSLSVW